MVATSSGEDKEKKTRREEERRGRKTRKEDFLGFFSRVDDSFASPPPSKKREAKRGEERAGSGTRRLEGGKRRRSERSREEFPQFWETLGGRKKAGKFSVNTELPYWRGGHSLASLAFFSSPMLSFRFSLLCCPHTHPWITKNNITILCCPKLFYSIFFYVILSNCIVLAFTKETKKNRKEYE